MHSKASCIFNIVWYSILFLFGVYFCLCPFVIHANEVLPVWKVFMWGVATCFDLSAGSLGLGYSIGELIAYKQEEKDVSDEKNQWY